MRSLWAGVSGLQAHQIAMDVEGNNIANVNTAGFKYSRVNFSDMLSQTAKIATAPQGELGGKNPMQIGLGTQVSSVTKIFKQGSVQTTDKNTDLAIQGDGFFVVSPDGGSTYKYSRNGDFSFDALGNFTDSNGYIIQGWVRDEDTGEIDSTTPIGNITIPPGLTTPANDTSYIILKANLNSGNTIVNKASIYQLDSNSGWIDKDGGGTKATDEIHNENDVADNEFNADRELIERGQDFGALFNANGESFNLRTGQGFWTSYKDAKTEAVTVTAAAGPNLIELKLNGISITDSFDSALPVGADRDNEYASYVTGIINAQSTYTGVEAQITSGNQISLLNTNKSGTESSMKNIDLEVSSFGGTGLITTEVITAFKYTYSSTPTTSSPVVRNSARIFTTTEDLRNSMQTDARLYTDYLGNGWDNAAEIAANKNDGVEVVVNKEGQFQISNPTGDALNANDGDIIDASTSAVIVTKSGTELTTELANEAITFPENATLTEDITLPALPSTTEVTINGTLYGTTAAALADGGNTIPAGTVLGNAVTIPQGSTVADTGNDFTLQVGTDYKSVNDHDMFLAISAYSDYANDVGENTDFTTTMAALQGSLTSGTAMRTTQNIYAANHASSIDVYDSLGTKHTVRFEFTKTGYTADGGTEWSILISVPEPGDINLGNYPENIVTGTISYNSDGSLASFSPTNLTYTANNGSTPNQNIELQFGSLGQFDGMTSFDGESNTSGISQDGYPGGDLAGIRVDETGTLIGSFTNGRSFGLAQVSMAKFTNNGGLESDGGNAFIQTSNSGDPIIGQAAVGGRGFIQASALEMSNVDLSRSLTQLIVVQRGFQANSKTITTSDQMLNTLLQLKQ
jgi:flagellar hook protein FlgE